jgi:hypothetical protein
MRLLEAPKLLNPQYDANTSSNLYSGSSRGSIQRSVTERSVNDEAANSLFGLGIDDPQTSVFRYHGYVLEIWRKGEILGAPDKPSVRRCDMNPATRDQISPVTAFLETFQ